MRTSANLRVPIAAGRTVRQPASTIAAASLGLGTGALSPAVAAAIVLAGCLTVLPAAIGTRRLADALTVPSAAEEGPGAAPDHVQEVTV